MTDSLLLLRLEHGNTTRLLNLLEEETRKLESAQPPDLELLESITEYLRSFPNQVHHPKEDLIYTMLEKRAPAKAEALGDLLAEHEKLAHFTDSLDALIRDHGDAPKQRRMLAQKLGDFVRFYRNHMALEEGQFFPAASAELTREDWADIDFEVFDRDDPMFGHSAADRFSALRERIAQMADVIHDRDAAQTEERRLENLSTVQAFNDLMSREGAEIRLLRFGAGGYGIESGGELLGRIPPCSEARAAWSAYYFWKGRSERN